jgi:hypothetical protein
MYNHRNLYEKSIGSLPSSRIIKNQSSAAKKSSAAAGLPIASSAAANAGHTKGKYVSGITNIFTGEPLPEKSKLRYAGVITKPSSAAFKASSAAKKSSAAAGLPIASSAAANAGDTEGKYVSGKKKIFPGEPLPKISELSPVVVITKPPKVKKVFSPSLKKMYPHRGNSSYSVPPRPPNGGSRRRTVHRKHKSYRKSKRVRHTRRKQTRRHRHRR